MADENAYVSLWKTSRRGLGERHLKDGYPASDFPGKPRSRPDGSAYFARDRWIAAEFARSSMGGYEEFLVEVRIPVEIYQDQYQRFEHRIVLGEKVGIELAIPFNCLDEMNRVGVRLRADWTVE